MDAPCPEEVDDLPQIESLILDNNKLTALPSLVKLVNLRELSADRQGGAGRRVHTSSRVHHSHACCV